MRYRDVRGALDTRYALLGLTVVRFALLGLTVVRYALLGLTVVRVARYFPKPIAARMRCVASPSAKLGSACPAALGAVLPSIFATHAS